MGQPTKTIALQFSNDGGSTFSTALTLKVRSIRVTKIPETDADANSITGREFEKRFRYYFVEFETDEKEFDPNRDANGDANWKALQDWLDSDTRRLYNGDTTNVPTLDGWDAFNASNNTNYLNLLDATPNFRQADEYVTTNFKRARSMFIRCKTRSAV